MLTCHDLRHTAASIAISSGANVKAVQRMLGHKNAAIAGYLCRPIRHRS
ncbi:tyrosine-type recombinase/integrase [Bifidobacterium longum]|nr:tyrosine-type recombinase/integrase [Bifidobacterium longum]